MHAEHFVTADDVSEYDKIKYQEFSAKVFGMVGGIALLTLVINAPTCGMLLKRLGLVTPTGKTDDKYFRVHSYCSTHFTLHPC